MYSNLSKNYISLDFCLKEKKKIGGLNKGRIEQRGFNLHQLYEKCCKTRLVGDQNKEIDNLIEK